MENMVVVNMPDMVQKRRAGTHDFFFGVDLAQLQTLP